MIVRGSIANMKLTVEDDDCPTDRASVLIGQLIAGLMDLYDLVNKQDAET